MRWVGTRESSLCGYMSSLCSKTSLPTSRCTTGYVYFDFIRDDSENGGKIREVLAGSERTAVRRS